MAANLSTGERMQNETQTDWEYQREPRTGPTLVALRPYQQGLLAKSQTALAPVGARVMMQLPTGGGKTEIAGALLKDFLVDGRKAVWLTHREELAEQSADRLKENWLIAAMRATEVWRRGKAAPHMPNGVSVLKAQTVGRRNKDSLDIWESYGPEDLLLVDEVHHSPAPGWERAINQWPGRVWGLTATPWRLSQREGFDHLFDTLIVGPPTAEMQKNGCLAPSLVFAPQRNDWIRGGAVGPSGDFTEGGIEQANEHPLMTTMAVNFWRNMAAERQTVAYAVSKGHAANLVREFEEQGIPAAAILSGTPSSDRERAIADFRSGRVRVLVNVAVVTEGFDLPDASCVMMTRPTKSLALYLQMVGRGLRPKEGGSDCLVLDLAGISEEHGPPELDRAWSLAARGNPDPGDPPGRHCHKCSFMSHPAHQNCPQCGTDLGKPCPLCVRFRPWSRWTDDCPIEHDPVCDRCHRDLHVKLGIGAYDGGHGSAFYLGRASECRRDGNLDAALADCYLAIHTGRRCDPDSDDRQIKLPAALLMRADIHFEMGNLNLALNDVDAAAALFEAGETFYSPLFLPSMYRQRARIYETLGRHATAEQDYQKAQEAGRS